MLLFLGAYLFSIVFLTIVFFQTRKIIRWISGTLAVILFLLPLCFTIFIGIFKSQIQQGKILPSMGSILLLFSPPEDIREPLWEHSLSNNRNEYDFEFQHKYVGKHILALKFGYSSTMETFKYDLSIRLTIELNGKAIYTKSSKKGWANWPSNSETWLRFISYDVPNDLPVGKMLNAKIFIDGDIEKFIDRYGETEIFLSKGSDK